MEEEELSMRDSIEAAITTLGDESGMEPSPDYEPAGDIDAKGETAETQEASKASKGEIPGEEQQTAAAAAAAGDDTAPGPGDDEQSIGDITKAPVSWSPAAREGWKDLSEPVRQQVMKRENEMSVALEDGKANRKQGEQFNDIAGRYAQVIAAEGVTDPIQGFEEMMKVMAQLRMGTPQQKAQKIAQFIGGYGVPIDILDQILSGQQAPGPNGANGGEGGADRSYIDKQLAPVHQLMTKLTQQEKNQNFQRNQAYLTEVQDFKADNEFYTDVSGDMADLVEMAGNRGYVMPLAEAYAKACAMNPEVSKIMADRANTASLEGGSKILQGKRDASSSLMSGQQQGMPTTEDMSLRETLSAAFDAQTG